MASLEAIPVRGTGSSGISYQKLLDTDTREIPEVLRLQSARKLPPAVVPIERYTSQDFFDLKVEKVWKKTWQMACREEEIPEIGDHVLYEIAGMALIVVRVSETEIKAHHNTCLHRGRALRDEDGRVSSFRCPFHGWHWNLDGTLKEVPARWDFDHVERKDYCLPSAKVATWGGFVFINMDPNAEPLDSFRATCPRTSSAGRSRSATKKPTSPRSWNATGR